MTAAESILDIVWRRAYAEPDALAFTFAARERSDDECWTNRQLVDRLGTLAGRLRARRAQRALLVAAPGPDFVCGLLGCFAADLTAVPVYPPLRTDSAARLRAVAHDCRPDLVVASPDYISLIPADLGAGPIESIDLNLPATATKEPLSTSNPLAILQYTSGSTGSPKGVMIGHRNLLHNLERIKRAFGHTPQSRGVSWLPPYHDMGLVGGVLQPLYAGFPVTLMSPQQFLLSPFSWLQRISKESASTSGGPNFAFDLCVRKVTAEQKAQLDLSQWSVCFTGSEAVRLETLNAFHAAFEQCGFKKEAFLPCYGLAESTLIVSGARGDHGLRTRPLAADASGSGAPTANVRQVVSVGKICDDLEVIIVDPETRIECAAGQIGEIFVAGESVALGYWNRPTITEQIFAAEMVGGGNGRFLRTGDLGFIADGEMFVTGRLKEILVLGGRKLHPEDIETVVRSVAPSFAGRKTIAFADGGDSGGIGIIQEATEEDTEQLADRIRAEVMRVFGLPVTTLALVKRSAIPVTPTGKVMRLEAARKLAAGTLPLVGGKRASQPQIGRRSLQRDIETLLGRRLVARDLRGNLVGLGIDSLALTSLLSTFPQLESVPSEAGIQYVEIGALLEACGERVAIAPEADVKPSVGRHLAETSKTHALSIRQQGRLQLLDSAQSSVASVISFAISIHGEVDQPRLERAIRDTIAAHEALRTWLRPETHAVTLREPGGIEWVPVGEGVDATTNVREFVSAEAARPLPLFDCALVRVIGYRVSRTHCVILFRVHHLIFDLYSAVNLVREFFARYETGMMPADNERRGYYEHARIQRERLSGHALAQLQDFWKNYLAGSDVSWLRRRAAVRPVLREAQVASALLPDHVAQQIARFNRCESSTLLATLLAACGRLLADRFGQRDATIGTIVSGRTAQTRHTIGLFINVLPVRVGIAEGTSFAEHVRNVRKSLGEAHRHSELPFELVREQLADPAPMIGHLDVFLNLYPDLGQHSQLSGKDIVIANYRIARVPRPALRPLTFDVIEETGKLRIVAIVDDTIVPDQASVYVDTLMDILRQGTALHRAGRMPSALNG